MLQRYARRGEESRRDEVATKWGLGSGLEGWERRGASHFLPILETGKAGWGPVKPRTPLSLPTCTVFVYQRTTDVGR
jgi:hypothetical protein